MLALLLMLMSFGTPPLAATSSVNATETGRYGEYGKILRAHVDGVAYTISAKHRLTRAGRTLVRLPTQGMPYIEGAHLLVTPGDRLFVNYGVTDSDGCGVIIVAVEPMARKVLWAHSVRATNPGPMRFDDGRLFVSAGGNILALDAATGMVVWALDGEWPGKDVEAFEAPREAGENLIYREWTGYQNQPREFSIRKLTGEVSAMPSAP